MSADGQPCLGHAGFNARISGLEKDFSKHDDNNNRTNGEMWAAINGVRNRPPVWATAVIALLTGLLGLAVGVGG